jgi:hypothetical protein
LIFTASRYDPRKNLFEPIHVRERVMKIIKRFPRSTCSTRAARQAGYPGRRSRQVNGQFGAQGSYLLDFYHVSEYLAAAAPPRQSGRGWLKRQQGYLLANRLGPTLQSLSRRLESPGAHEHRCARPGGI